MPSSAPLVLRGQRFDAGRPAVMAIVNRTPDSFFSGNRLADLDAAKRAVETDLEAGADIIDVGGVRAGQQGEPVGPAEEIKRVVPFLEWARAAHPEVILSLDTWRSEVAREAGAVGLDLVNDTWAAADPDLVHVAAALGAGYVVSHTGGLPPRTDPVDVSYGDDPLDVVRDVITTLGTGAGVAELSGIPRERILVDPTLDFGKTTANSLEVLRHTAEVVALGYPVLQAVSRKDFVGEALDLPAEERLEGSLAATAVAAWLGAIAFRAHDVRATRRVLDMVATIRGDRAPRLALRGVRRPPAEKPG
ncbi:dihydropteroate synthase [Intrasporangium sp.]|uniref:dihydropteroate synthase n=1 Tax=Intrasporangium sp. TaxID=1925024 RepID=UPI003221FA40